MKGRRITSVCLIFLMTLGMMNFGAFNKAYAASMTLQEAMEAVNSAEKASEVAAVLAELDPEGWDDLTGTAKRTNAPDVVMALRPETKYTDAAVFMDAVNLGLAMGRINDFNYYDNPLSDYIEYLNRIDAPGFRGLTEDEKLAFVSLMKYINGLDDDGCTVEFDYDYPLVFVDIYNNAIDSIESAQVHVPTAGTDGKINVGAEYDLENTVSPQDGQILIYISTDRDSATIDLYTGRIVPMVYGTDTLGYLVYDEQTGAIKAYGFTDVRVDDALPPESEVFRPESGYIDSLIVTFSEEMHADTLKIDDAADMIDSIAITGGITQDSAEIKSAGDSVQWITNRTAKIKIPEIKLVKGNIITVSYKPEVMDLAGNQAKTAVLPAVTEDKIAPKGKILYMEPGIINRITVVFNERMSSETKQITNIKDFLKSVTLKKGMRDIGKIEVNSAENSVQWTEIDGKDAAYVSVPDTEIKEDYYVALEYTNDVKDVSGNLIDSRPAVVPIGGALETDSDSIYEAIRINAGGKTPIIAVVGSSSENLADAQDTYNSLSSAQGAYAFAKHGFEPVFIPIAMDNYTEAAVSADNIELLNKAYAVFFQGGDQMRHARCFIEDDGSDSPLLTAVRYVYASGGVESGTSAGDHIMSNPMYGNGNSYGDLSHNGMIFNKITDDIDEIGDEDNGRSGINTGFGFASPYGVTDSHFDIRGRLGRMIVAMRDTNQNTGIGIDENTAVLLKNGKGTVIGENAVFLADGSSADYARRYEEDPNVKFYAYNMKLSYLTDGDVYDFVTGTITSSKKAIGNQNGIAAVSNDIFDDYENARIIKSLADSSAQSTYGVTEETDPQFKVTYTKQKNTKIYKESGRYTVDKLRLDIEAVGQKNGGAKHNDKDHSDIAAQVNFSAGSGEQTQNAGRVKRFDDVNPGAWYSRYVEAMTAENIISGYPDNTFRGNEGISRGDFAVIIAKILKLSPAEYKGCFGDIGKDDYYAGYIQALADKGIMNGRNAFAFMPDDKITREEVFKIIGLLLKNVEADTEAIKRFKDAGMLSSWAAEGTSKAVKAQIIAGSGEMLNPKGNLTRYEAAAIAYKLFIGLDIK